MKHLYTIQHIFLGELAQVIARLMESISARPILDGSAQKMIDKFSIPHLKYRKSWATDRFSEPMTTAPDQRTTKMTRLHGSSSKSKTSVDTLYIGVGAVGLLLATGGVIFLTKWILKKKIQGRVIDVDFS